MLDFGVDWRCVKDAEKEYLAEALALVALHRTDIHDRSGSLAILDDVPVKLGIEVACGRETKACTSELVRRLKN